MKALHHLPRDFAVEVVAHRHNDQARAEPERLPHRHRGTDAHPPGGVGAGSNYSSFFGFSSYGKWLAAQFRIVSLFDSTIEGVQVNMQDRAGHAAYYKEKRVIKGY